MKTALIFTTTLIGVAALTVGLFPPPAGGTATWVLIAAFAWAGGTVAGATMGAFTNDGLAVGLATMGIFLAIFFGATVAYDVVVIMDGATTTTVPALGGLLGAALSSFTILLAYGLAP